MTSLIIRVLRARPSGELHNGLLAGRHGAAIRGLARLDGMTHWITRAADVLRVKHLATVGGISASTFHHFRVVTSLSPVQFQGPLRPIEAR